LKAHAFASSDRLYSIRQKLTWMNMLVSGAALLLACTAFASYELADLRQTLVRSISIQAGIAGANSASAILFNDADSARNTLSALSAAPYILAAGIYTPDGQPFAAWSRDSGTNRLPPRQDPIRAAETYKFTGRELVLIRAIDFQGKQLGLVRIQSDLAEINDRLLGFAGIVGAVLLMSLLAAFAFSSIFQKTTARPIAQLAETAHVVSREKNYSVRAPLTTNAQEIAVLIQAFNEMLDQIQERDTALQRARTELEARVVRRTAQLEAVNRELESFTYSVAHDLRAPLRHIQGFTDALLEDCGTDVPAEAKTHLARIVESTRRMDQLINDLLGLAHVGRQDPQLKPTALTALVRDVTWDLGAELRDRHIEWRIQKLPVISCDPGLIKLAFQNLLSNAVKYTRPRDPAVIEVGHTVIDNEIAYYVRDNGVGFNMKYAHKLFGVFERLHRREDFEGTGVGLATVQRIVHKHAGRIWADAEIDRGATFFFTLGNSPAQTASGSPLNADDQ
jgi:signal transduction histidine kinase